MIDYKLTYFGNVPIYCPMCRERLSEDSLYNQTAEFNLGHVLWCKCGFNYTKFREPQACDAGHSGYYLYFIDGVGETRCAMCDLEVSEAKIKTLEEIIKADDKELNRRADNVFTDQAEIIADKVVDLVREQTHDALTAILDIPIGELIRIHMSGGQMDADKVETGTASITYLGKADPFIAID